jgi:hypothetical protein
MWRVLLWALCGSVKYQEVLRRSDATYYPSCISIGIYHDGSKSCNVIFIQLIHDFNQLKSYTYYYRGSTAVCLALTTFQFILYTDGRTPCTGDQPVARPLPVHRINAHNTNIHALSGIRTHDPSVRASEYRSCLRPRGQCDRLIIYIINHTLHPPAF